MPSSSSHMPSSSRGLSVPDPRASFHRAQVWSTNLIIAMVTGVATNVLYSMGASDFDGAKLQSALWLVSVVVKLMDSSGDVAAMMQSPVEPVIALLVTVLAWM